MFFINNKKRYRLTFLNGKYHLVGSNISYKKDEIINKIKNNSEELSPNVILRPLYQEYLLPNLSYVGGNAEISYWLQLKSLGLEKAPYVGLFEDKLHFWENLEKLLPYFRRVEFAGGEPLMDPSHYKILDLLSKNGKNIEIKYATNGTTLGIKGGRTVHEYWPKFKSVAVNVSIDGLHDTYEYIRGNGKFSDVEYNIKEMKKIPTVTRIVGAFTVQANNILQIDKVIDYFLNEMQIVFYSHRVNYPRALSAQVLPEKLKQAVVVKLEAMKSKVKDYEMIKKYPVLEKITMQQIQDNINFLQARDLHEHWNDCVDFNRKLDETRNQGPFEKINPEFANYV